MKRISLTIALLTGFAVNLMAVPAVPFLITFAQPDGSTFQAHLRGDEHFSWIETENKQVLVKESKERYLRIFSWKTLLEKEPFKLYNDQGERGFIQCQWEEK